ncbi:hypothetical protein DV737_g5112, partial [Chaetothyriales sp. CBS 132003]
MPSRSVAALANWLAGWDVLKSEREKKWWLGDGIDLVNKAKAMGYQGAPNSKKYDVIVWLRSTPEDVELDVAGEVAEPTLNKNSNPAKRKAGEAVQQVSKRRAKGSKRREDDVLAQMFDRSDKASQGGNEINTYQYMHLTPFSGDLAIHSSKHSACVELWHVPQLHFLSDVTTDKQIPQSLLELPNVPDRLARDGDEAGEVGNECDGCGDDRPESGGERVTEGLAGRREELRSSADASSSLSPTNACGEYSIQSDPGPGPPMRRAGDELRGWLLPRCSSSDAIIDLRACIRSCISLMLLLSVSRS